MSMGTRCSALLLHCARTHKFIFLPFLFCLAHLANATSISPPTHTQTHTDDVESAQRLRAHMLQFTAARERKRVRQRRRRRRRWQRSKRRASVRLKFPSPNNCRYCHYFWPTFKWKRERQQRAPLHTALRICSLSQRVLFLPLEMSALQTHDVT